MEMRFGPSDSDDLKAWLVDVVMPTNVAVITPDRQSAGLKPVLLVIVDEVTAAPTSDVIDQVQRLFLDRSKFTSPERWLDRLAGGITGWQFHTQLGGGDPAEDLRHALAKLVLRFPQLRIDLSFLFHVTQTSHVLRVVADGCFAAVATSDQLAYVMDRTYEDVLAMVPFVPIEPSMGLRMLCAQAEDADRPPPKTRAERRRQERRDSKRPD